MDQVPELLRQFDRTEEIEVLRRALDALASTTAASTAPNSDSSDVVSQKTRLFLDVFNAIDGKSIANFNFDARPSMTTAPPPESGLPAGVDPESIADPTLRARYVKDIAIDQQKVRTYKLQSDLRKIDREAAEAFERHIEEGCRQADAKILDKIIEDTVRSKARREFLKSRVSALLQHRR